MGKTICQIAPHSWVKRFAKSRHIFEEDTRMPRPNSLSLLLVAAMFALLSDALAQTPAEPRVDASKSVALSLSEAVARALANSRDIEVERLNVLKNEFDVKAAHGAYDPTFSSSLTFERRNTPVASILAGGENGKLTTNDLFGQAKLARKMPWQGGSMSVSFEQNRSTTQNQFFALNPQYSTSLFVEYTQPLLRNRKMDAERRKLKIAKKKLDLSDSQFRQRAIEIIASVERAYWDLAFARRDEAIKRASVALANTQLEHNLRQVAQGTLAPAEVTSARVEIARRTDEAEAATETIVRAENALKALLSQPSNDELWNATITPTDQPDVRNAAPMLLGDALKTAFTNRPELEQYRLRGELNGVDVEYQREQTKPQVDFVAGYGTLGLAGSARTETNPIIASNQQLIDRINQLSQVAGLPALTPVSFGTIPDRYYGGYGQSLANMFRNDSRTFRVGVNIALPLGNRTAKANLGRALVEGKQLDVERQRAEHQIEVEVRNAVQAVETAQRRIAAAKASRSNAELQLKSEQNKFDAGLSTNFLVLDRQNALSLAQGRELKAITDYNKAVSELQRALATTLTEKNIEIASR
jgi:HAE1 family hydrophobic/amphiphilic exporter-1